MTDLLFTRLLPVGHPVDMTFGQPMGPVQDAAGHLEIVLPPFAPSFEGRLAYDNAVSRSDVITAGGAWQQAKPVAPTSLHASIAPAEPIRGQHLAPWGRGGGIMESKGARWRKLRSTDTPALSAWRQALPLSRSLSASRWQVGLHTSRTAAEPWQDAVTVPASVTRSPSRVAIIVRLDPCDVPWGSSLPSALIVATSAQVAHPLPVVPVRIPWQWAAQLRPGRSPRPVTPTPEPWRCYTPPAGGGVHLLFDERSTPGFDILFSCGSSAGAGPLVIPTLRAYIVINSATLTRVSNNLRLPLRDISISGGIDATHWAWSATLPLRALADLEPDAPGELVELEARLNDMPWRLLVEKRAESERFGSGSLRISGRGIAAELSAPGAASTPRSNPSAATAQQLAAAALTINGVPNGWALTWQGADWQLPAGLWAHTGTPIEAVLRLAEAAGAYVLPAPAARSLAVIPRYPAAPWEWASLAPGVVLPAAATLERGSDEIVRPGYNIVFVCGRDINARVKRIGSAGDRPAQMIVDPLTAHADAARQRGLAVLAEANSHRMERLETGILPGYGVIQIGTVLDWIRGQTTRRGIVRELAVAASLPGGTSKDPVKVRQTLGVEIHG